MERANTINQQSEAFILQYSQCNLVHKFFDINTLQKLAKGRKRPIHNLSTSIPDHLNFNPPYFHEYWRPHPWIPGLWGSHLGRVFLTKKQDSPKKPPTNYLKSSELPPGNIVTAYLQKRYMYAHLPIPRTVYRIVAECWFWVKKGWHVHHINNNSFDCTIENLIPLHGTFHMAIHKPHKYQKKHSSPQTIKILKNTHKSTSENKKNSFIGIFHPRWKGFILVYSGSVSKEPQMIFRHLEKFSTWFLEIYSPLITKGPRKGSPLTLEDINTLALSPQSNFFLNFNICIAFWIPPLSIREKWNLVLPQNSEIDKHWICPPTFENIKKMQNS